MSDHPINAAQTQETKSTCPNGNRWPTKQTKAHVVWACRRCLLLTMTNNNFVFVLFGMIQYRRSIGLGWLVFQKIGIFWHGYLIGPVKMRLKGFFNPGVALLCFFKVLFVRHLGTGYAVTRSLRHIAR